MKFTKFIVDSETVVEVHFRLLGTNGFRVKAKNERFDYCGLSLSSEPQMWKIYVVVWQITPKKLRQKACRTCSTIIFSDSANHIIDLWRCRCRCRCRRHFLNSLVKLTHRRRRWLRGRDWLAYLMSKNNDFRTRCTPCTCISHFETFDWRPLWNNNVKWPNLKSCGGRLHTTLKVNFFCLWVSSSFHASLIFREFILILFSERHESILLRRK